VHSGHRPIQKVHRKISKAVACVAVLSPDNSPILVKKYCDDVDDLVIDTHLFCSLDYFDAQMQQRKTTGKAVDRFIGNLPPSENRLQTWGYRANLAYKIVVLTLATTNVPETAIRGLCEKLKEILFDCIMDPFYVPFSTINTKSALQRVADAVQAVALPQV
jgi:hypothetical protein